MIRGVRLINGAAEAGAAISLYSRFWRSTLVLTDVIIEDCIANSTYSSNHLSGGGAVLARGNVLLLISHSYMRGCRTLVRAPAAHCSLPARRAATLAGRAVCYAYDTILLVCACEGARHAPHSYSRSIFV